MTGRDFVTKMVEALNTRDYPAFLALHDPDVTLTTGGGLTVKGPQAAAQFGWAVLEAFPDARVSIGSIISEGEWVCGEEAMEGTHTRPLRDPSGQQPDVPPTGKRVVLKAAGIFRLKDGKVTDVRVYVDNLSLLAQLGLLPAPTATRA
jgi:predicted ester cyclase